MISLQDVVDRFRDWTGLGLSPLERAIIKAHRTLERMTSAGIVVPDDVIRGIMVAVTAMRDDGLNADVEAAFYAANVRLVRLRRGLHYDDEGEIEKPFDAAVADADLLLKFASERGLDVPRETVQPILATRSAVAAGTLTDTIQADFYPAYGRLCKQFGEVTADTIRACRSEATKRTLRYNRIIALTLTTLIAISSVTVFVTDSLSDNLQKNVVIANESAAKLRATLTQDDISAALGSDTQSTDPCGLLTEPPSEHRRNIMTAAEIEPLQHFAATVRDIRSQAIKLNVIVGGIECDPFASCGASRTAFCTSACYDDSSIPIVYRFELNPAIRNYTAEVLCKIKTYQSVRSFASNVQSDYRAAIGALAAYAFPIFYALLGAYAFRLRLFVDTIRNRTYHPSFADSARMITSVIAGAIVGLFNPATGFSLSPLATAFLVGYGVELFFRFLDTLLNAFGSSSGSAPRASRTPQ